MSEDIATVMKRIEDTTRNELGKNLVKGTMMTKGEDIIRSTLDHTTSEAIKTHFLGTLKDLCYEFIREIDNEDDVDFIRADFKEKIAGRTTSYQIGMTIEGDCSALYFQQYRTRDLRIRNNKDQRDVEGYLYIQKNPFNPTQD